MKLLPICVLPIVYSQNRLASLAWGITNNYLGKHQQGIGSTHHTRIFSQYAETVNELASNEPTELVPTPNTTNQTPYPQKDASNPSLDHSRKPTNDPSSKAKSKQKEKPTVWVPPSQNSSQRRGKVFSIQKPQDLLDFVIDDERLSVVKVFASWCKTCKVFDVRYRKLASQLGDKYDASQNLVSKGRVRFAEMQYDNPANEEMCQLLNATKLPYIIMYKGKSKGKVAEFQCLPSEFGTLVEKVNELADPADELGEGEGTNAAGNLTGTKSKELVNETLSEAGETKELDAASLQNKILSLQKEKDELRREMQQTIDYDKNHIENILAAIELQNDDYAAILESKDKEIEQLKKDLDRLTQQRADGENEIASLSNQVIDLSQTLLESNETISSLRSELTSVIIAKEEVESHLNETLAANLALKSELALSLDKHEQQLKEQKEDWDQQQAQYEAERKSLRKLARLACTRVWSGTCSLVSRVRRKGAQR